MSYQLPVANDDKMKVSNNHPFLHFVSIFPRSQNAHFNEILISFFMPFNTIHCFKMNPVNWVPLFAADVVELSTSKEN